MHEKNKEEFLQSPEIFAVLTDVAESLKKKAELVVKENAEAYCSLEAIEEFFDSTETIFSVDGLIVG